MAEIFIMVNPAGETACVSAREGEGGVIGPERAEPDPAQAVGQLKMPPNENAAEWAPEPSSSAQAASSSIEAALTQDKEAAENALSAHLIMKRWPGAAAKTQAILD